MPWAFAALGCSAGLTSSFCRKIEIEFSSYGSIEVMPKNRSPLRYPGGKTRARKLLLDIYDETFGSKGFDRVVSPFFGGGSFEFYLQEKRELNILANDKFAPLLDFWETAKTRNEQLAAALRDISMDKARFLEFREEVLSDPDQLSKAVKLFAINRCSFSGATLSGGFSQEASEKRFNAASIDRVAALDLSGVLFSSEDFKEFLDRCEPEDFIFADPPYLLEKGSKLYGKNGDLHETFDHAGLASVLKEKKNWILTYNDCKKIRDLYAGYEVRVLKWSYGMNRTKESSEIVIISAS